MHRPLLVCLLMLEICRALSQSIPNGSFESWSFENGYSEPSQWVTNNDLSLIYGADYTATQELPGTDGDYYLKLTVQLAENIGELLPAKAFVGEYTFPSADTTHGFAVNQIATQLVGDYRSLINDNDAATISCLFSKWNESAITTDTIGYGIRVITESASDWIQFEIPFTIVSQEIPDSCRIMLTAGGANSSLGTTLEIDNLHFIGDVRVGEQISLAPFSYYPNPIHDNLFLDLSSMSAACDVWIYDTQGRCVSQFHLNNNLHMIRLSELTAGLYTMHIHDDSRHWSTIICKQ